MWKIIFVLSCIFSINVYSQSVVQATIKSISGKSTLTSYGGLFSSLFGIGGETTNTSTSQELVFKDTISVESGKVDLVTNKGVNISVLDSSSYVIGLQNMGELEYGEVYYNGNIPFKIQLGHTSVQVKGTEFLISYQGSKLKNGVYVVKGELELKEAFSFSKTQVSAGEQYIFEEGEVTKLDSKIKNYIETKLRGKEIPKGIQNQDNNDWDEPYCECENYCY
ncbi:MAG: hypothetical protein H7A23_25450 [Leptospiraceae bacterium]|nr:hypothetical protein [Leptospiraceae bacterium]